MKANLWKTILSVAVAVLAISAGCNRQSRGNADAEGGATTPENTGK
jgi:hypothetical protein